MNMGIVRKAFVITMLLAYCLLAGCEELAKTGAGKKELTPDIKLGATIGSMTEVIAPESIAVEGYGLVGGLNGTGSSECPPQIRAYLKRYILTQLANQQINTDKLIDSPNTAVVLIEGVLPAVPSKNQSFDVKVTSLPGTRTTSLEGGWLYGAEFKAAGSFGIATKTIADADGPIFIDKIDEPGVDKRTGFILAGGRILDDYTIALVFRKPDYQSTSDVRNRLNELFGEGTARAVSPGRIELTVPEKYKNQKEKFVSIIKATYLNEMPEITEQRINTFIRMLAASENKEASGIALEAIGNESLSKLSVLLKSSDEQVRLRAARCMLNLGSNAGTETLREIAMNGSSSYRVEALEAIITGTNRNEASAIGRKLLRDNDFEVSLAAYEQLRKLDDIAITGEFIGRSFFLEQIAQTQHKAIFVSRSGQPRIVLFGAPILCRGNIFVQSENGKVIINAPAGQKYVSLIRKYPKRPDVMANLKSSFELSDIIRKLCEEPTAKGEEGRRGLGVSYAEMIVLLKQMCDKGGIRADFRAGPLPKISTGIKK